MKSIKRVFVLIFGTLATVVAVASFALMTWLYYQPSKGDLDYYSDYRSPVIYVWEAATPLDYTTFDETDQVFCWNNMLFSETGFMGLNSPVMDDTGTVIWCEYNARFSDVYEEAESRL
jgi:hypothetical protein